MAGSVIPKAEARRFLVECLTKVGACEEQAGVLSEVLLAGDIRGHYSHGLNRLAWVDGRNLLGPVVGNFSMDLAMRKAKEAGLGWVVAKNSNHFGIAGYYTMKCSEQGMLGLAFTNTSPGIFPTRAAAPGLGTNPISLAAPGMEGDEFVLDMATSTVARGKIELAAGKGESIPAGWAVTSKGKETTDPSQVFPDGGLLPLGGPKVTGGYKGFGLAALVEAFCGVLAGSKSYGPAVRKQRDFTRPYDVSHCFVAIDPAAFAPDFQPRLQDLMNSVRRLPQAEEGKAVLVAGDPEREAEADVAELGGIPYHEDVLSKAVYFSFI